VVAPAAEEIQMLKRALLALTFVAALGAAGFGISSQAEAGHGCGYGYRSHYYPSHYSHYDGYDYGSRISYYRAHERHHRHYDHYPNHHHGRHHHHGSGVHFSIGF
jgi:hypothetical protein